jgi:hypothetical protein
LKKLTPLQFKPISANIAIDLYTGLINARRTKLQPALSEAVKTIGVIAVDDDLRRLVSPNALTHLASLGIRGERVFPVPVVIRQTPTLIGYYRMLLGLSQKEFGQSQRMGYGPWVNAENSGRLSPVLLEAIDQFCVAIIAPLEQLVETMGQFTDRDLSDMSLLTLGSTLQGGRNNAIGSKAAIGILNSIRELLRPIIIFDSTRLLRIKNSNGQFFEIITAGDPDIAISKVEGTNKNPIVAIEIKGGKDASNAHNRAGEAEKSHIKAKSAGYLHRWTIIHMAGVSRTKICQNTPTSTEVFDTEDILQQSGADWSNFQQKLKQILAG